MYIRHGVFFLAVLTWGLVGLGVYQSFQDPYFALKSVEISGVSDDAPVSANQIRKLASLSVDSHSMMAVSLKNVEKSILSHLWIKSVRLEKKLPHTLSIAVDFREPVAIYQSKEGHLSYLDRDGVIFGPIQSVQRLPVVAGLSADRDVLKETVNAIQDWKNLKEVRGVTISSISWDSDRGYRLTVIYPIKASGNGRTMLSLGKNIDFSTPEGKKQIQRLSSVFKYLSEKQIVVRQIFAEVGKKIIVKIAQRS